MTSVVVSPRSRSSQTSAIRLQPKLDKQLESRKKHCFAKAIERLIVIAPLKRIGHVKGITFSGICLREEGYSSPKNICGIEGKGKVDLGRILFSAQ